MRIFKVVLLSFLPFLFCGQSITIRDSHTKKPIDYVLVSSKTNHTYTDAQGVALLDSLGDGSTLISIQKFGYQTISGRKDSLAKRKTILLETTQIDLEEVTVATTKWEKSTYQIPNQTLGIEKKEIQFRNTQTAADLLAPTGQVFVQKSQLGGGSPMIRGFATSRILLVVDGIRMNNAIFREGNVQNVISIDGNALQDVEVLFGPGSVIYGSDAMGGVLNYKTLIPQYSTSKQGLTSFNAFARFSSANFERTGHVDFTLANSKLASLTSITFSDYQDLRMGNNGPDFYTRPEYQAYVNGKDTVLQNSDENIQVKSGYHQFNFIEKLRYRASKNWELEGGFYYSTTSDIPRYDRLIQYRNGALRFGDWYYGPQNWMMVRLGSTNKRRNAFFDELKTQVAFQNFQESRISRNFGSTQQRNQLENLDALSFNLDLKKTLNHKTRFFYGAEYLINQVSSKAFYRNIETEEKTNTQTRYPNGSDWQNLGVYLQGEYDLSQKTYLTGGLRYTFIGIDASFDTSFISLPFTSTQLRTGAINGSIGITRKIAASGKIYTNLSSGFRSPNIDDIGKVFESGDGILVIPNPDLNPEYLWNIEMGFSKIWNKKFQLDLTGFYSVLTDAITRRPTTLNGSDQLIFEGDTNMLQSLQNVESAQLFGLFGKINADITKDLGWFISGNYAYGETSDNEPLRHVAPFEGRSGFTYHIGWWKLLAEVHYNGEISADRLAPTERDKNHLYLTDDSGQLFSPSWWTLNVKASYQINKKIGLKIGIDNILDKRYRPYSSGITAPGINVQTSLHFNF